MVGPKKRELILTGISCRPAQPHFLAFSLSLSPSSQYHLKGPPNPLHQTPTTTSHIHSTLPSFNSPLSSHLHSSHRPSSLPQSHVSRSKSTSNLLGPPLATRSCHSNSTSRPRRAAETLDLILLPASLRRFIGRSGDCTFAPSPPRTETSALSPSPPQLSHKPFEARLRMAPRS